MHTIIPSKIFHRISTPNTFRLARSADSGRGAPLSGSDFASDSDVLRFLRNPHLSFIGPSVAAAVGNLRVARSVIAA